MNEILIIKLLSQEKEGKEEWIKQFKEKVGSKIV